LELFADLHALVRVKDIATVKHALPTRCA
jgi:hypothetical protein